MGIFSGQKQASSRINSIQVNESSYGRPVAALLGQQRVHQTIVWTDGLVSWKYDQGGKGGGKGGSQYLYAGDVIAALCNGPVTSVADVWDGQSWLSKQWGGNTFTVSSNGIYAPANAAQLVSDNGVVFETTYSATYNDYGAPAATVLSGTDYAPLQKVPYGTALTTGQYSVNPISIGTFTLTTVANNSGGNTVYTGTITGGVSPYGSGASNAYIGFTFIITGFTNVVNNGTFICVASDAAHLTLANANGVAESHAGTAAETGNSYHFCTSDAGTTAIQSYQYTVQDMVDEQIGVVPSGGRITVGGTFNPTKDLGVWYYDTTGTGATMVQMQGVSGTPTAKGQYYFKTPGDSSTGGATYIFYVAGGAGGDFNQEVLMKWQYQNNSVAPQNTGNLLKFELFGGSPGQAIWPFILSGGTVQIGNQDSGQSPTEPAFPGEALGYSNTAYLAYGPMALGASGAPANVTVEATTPWSYGGYYSSGCDEGKPIVDCNPVTAIFQVLTNRVWGLGSGSVPFPTSVIDNGPSGTWGTISRTVISPTASQTKNPGSAAQTGSDWQNPTRIINPNGILGNGSYGPGTAFIETTSGQTLYANNFGYTVPGTALVTGIEVHWASRGFDAHGTNVPTVLNISLETSAGSAAVYRTVPVNVNASNVLGGPTDNWGLSLTAAQVNALTFGIGFQAGPGAAWGSAVWNCYVVVYYSTVAPGTRTTDSTAASFFASNNAFLSAYLETQDSASTVVGKWLEMFQCGAFFSEGLLKLVPYGTQSAAANGCTWTAPSSVVVALDDTSFVRKEGKDPLEMERGNPYDAHNKVSINWTNRAVQYSNDLVEDGDQASIDRYGELKEDPQTFSDICQLSAATFAANMRIKRLGSIRNKYKGTLSFIYSYLEPMDLVSVSTSSQWAAGLNNVNLGLVNITLRVTKKVDKPDGSIDFEFENTTFAAGMPTLYNKGVSSGQSIVNAYKNPGNTEIVMFEAPARLTQNYSGNQIWIGGVGADSADWGSCNVWVSQDNTKYQQVGTITQPARLGELASTFGSGGDPDENNELIVNLAQNCGALEAGTSTDADSGNTLCFVDGEIIAYSSCTVTGQDQYTMNLGAPSVPGYIRRGQMGSTISAHVVNPSLSPLLFMRLDSAIYKYTYDPNLAGKTLYFKFQSVNNFGNMAQDLSTLTPVVFTVPGVNPGTVDATNGLILGAAAEMDNLADGTNYARVKSTALTSGQIDLSKAGVLAKGNTPPAISGNFSYTSTTTSITISWTSSMALYRADGTITAIGAGSQTITSLTASTQYNFYPVYDEALAELRFISESDCNFPAFVGATLDGASGYISTATALGNPGSFSVECWVNTASSAVQPLFQLCAPATMGTVGNQSFLMWFQSGIISAWGYLGSSIVQMANVSVGFTLKDGKCHHILLTWDNSAHTCLVYVDGVLCTNSASPSAAFGVLTGMYWKVGAANGKTGWTLTTDYYGASWYSNAAVYSSVLTANQVAAHYSTGTNLGQAAYDAAVIADGATYLWKLGETGGTTAADSADSNTGTYQGTETLNISNDLFTGIAGSPSIAFTANKFIALQQQNLQSRVALSPGPIQITTPSSGTGGGSGVGGKNPGGSSVNPS